VIALRTTALTLSLAAALAAGCGQSITGMPCDPTAPCPDHWVCALAHDGIGRCMHECDTTQTVCNDGRVCAYVIGTGTGACYLGGNVGVGQTCTTTLDCARGGLCVDRFADGALVCMEGCNLDGSRPCLDGSACLGFGGDGFCNFQTR
jgi:hypothetical protein